MRGLRSNRATKAKTRADRVRESKPEVEKGPADVRCVSQCTARVYPSIASVATHTPRQVWNGSHELSSLQFGTTSRTRSVQ